MNGNDFMAWVLRSPFHGMLNGMMLITVTGRKTGKKYTTPVGYYEDDGFLWIVTSRDRTWWRNLKGGAEVDLLLKRQQAEGMAEPVLEMNAVETRLLDYIKFIPQAARSFGIRIENGKANMEDVSRIAKDRLFVKIELSR